MKRHSFTLVEVLVAFALLALISATLFSSFKRQTLLKVELTKAESSILERKYFQERLSQIFDKLEVAEEGFLFTDEKQDLNFVFDNGIDPKRVFCHTVFGKLSLRNHKLILELESLDRKEKREEILFENVDKIEFRFVTIPAKTDSFGRSIIPTTWEKSEKSPPRILQITPTIKGDEIEYAFFLDHNAITYTK